MISKEKTFPNQKIGDRNLAEKQLITTLKRANQSDLKSNTIQEVPATHQSCNPIRGVEKAEVLHC